MKEETEAVLPKNGTAEDLSQISTRRRNALLRLKSEDFDNSLNNVMLEKLDACNIIN
jgi:hypothetical protein